MDFLTLRLVTVGLIATASLNAESSLDILNNRLAKLYQEKARYDNKLMSCEIKYKNDSSKKCHDLESKCYEIKDEIKRLEPKIREKELLLIIDRNNK